MALSNPNFDDSMIRESMKNTLKVSVISWGACLLSTSAIAAPATTEWGSILSVEAGWGQPYMHLEMSFPAANPEACPWSGLYTIAPDVAGYETFQSLAMSAYFTGKQVSFTLDGCAGNRPKVIGVRVRG